MKLIRQAMLVAAATAVLAAAPAPAQTPTNALPPAEAPAPDAARTNGPSPAEIRVILDKWIETQQILSRERKDWQQGKELLQARIEMVSKELEGLDEKIKQAEAKAAEVNKSRDDILAGIAGLKKTGTNLTEAATRLEAEIRRLYPALPDPVSARIKPIYDRVPANPAETKVSAAERFQNVLGILNEVNKANNDLPITFEVRTLASSKPAEVRVVYVGLAQAYYLGAGGETGVGRPSPAGWKWEPAPGLTHVLRKVIEIQEGKQPPAFVPLPCTLQ